MQTEPPGQSMSSRHSCWHTPVGQTSPCGHWLVYRHSWYSQTPPVLHTRCSRHWLVEAQASPTSLVPFGALAAAPAPAAPPSPLVPPCPPPPLPPSSRGAQAGSEKAEPSGQQRSTPSVPSRNVPAAVQTNSSLQSLFALSSEQRSPSACREQPTVPKASAKPRPRAKGRRSFWCKVMAGALSGAGATLKLVPTSWLRRLVQTS